MNSGTTDKTNLIYSSNKNYSSLALLKFPKYIPPLLLIGASI